MSNKFTDFPQFRMISGRKVYYKITSERQFIELSWIGEKQFTVTVNAIQYPEILRIIDMINCELPFELLPKQLENLFE